VDGEPYYNMGYLRKELVGEVFVMCKGWLWLVVVGCSMGIGYRECFNVVLCRN